MKRFTVVLFALLVLGTFAFAGGQRGGGASGGNIDVGISMPTQSTERWVIEGNEMVKQLNALGHSTILQFAEDHPDQQINQIENMLNRGIKVLICAPVDGTALDGVLRQVKASGTLVIAYDRLLEETQHVDFYCTFDSIYIGGLMGGHIVDKLGLKTGARGPFNVELFAGSLDDNNTPLYFDGAMDQLRPYINSGALVVKSGQTNLNQCAILGWAAEVAQARMDNILAANYADGSRVDAVLSPYDGLSIGIISSLKAVGYGSANRPFPVITGQDAELPSIKAILAGEQTHTVALDLLSLAQVAVTMADQHIKGQRVVTTMQPIHNGVKNVPAEGGRAVSADASNIVRLMVEFGLYTEAEMRN